MRLAASAILSLAMTFSAFCVACPAVSAHAQATHWKTASCQAAAGDQHSLFSWGHQERVCELRTTTLGPDRPEVAVSAENGSIAVTGEDRSDILVEARVEAWAGSVAAAKDLLGDIVIDTAAGRIHDHGPSSFFGNSGYAVSYRLRTPHHLSVNLNTANGGIEISHLDGDIRFNTTNGGVSLDALAGDVHGQTVNGRIKVALTGDRWSGSGLKAGTTNGGVTLTIPDHYAAHLEARTVNGRVRTHIPVTVQGDITDHLSADLNGGGPTIHVETTNGGVQIERSEGGQTASQ